MSTTTNSATTSDASNGYEAVAPDFIRRCEQSSIDIETVCMWPRSLPRGGAILDLGCGSGVPTSTALSSEGFAVYGIDASASVTDRPMEPAMIVAMEPFGES